MSNDCDDVKMFITNVWTELVSGELFLSHVNWSEINRRYDWYKNWRLIWIRHYHHKFNNQIWTGLVYPISTNYFSFFPTNFRKRKIKFKSNSTQHNTNRVSPNKYCKQKSVFQCSNAIAICLKNQWNELR